MLLERYNCYLMRNMELIIALYERQSQLFRDLIRIRVIGERTIRNSAA